MTSIKVRDIDLGAFQILSVGIWWVIDIVTWLFFSGVWSPVGDSSGSRVAFTLASLSLNVLRVSNLEFISANIAVI